jgi:carbonic anhydrase
MRLLEAIVEANHRAVTGDGNAGVHPGDFADALPLAALTCIDARLNAFFPGVLGLPKEEFIWLRNAGNIITGPVSSTMRSLALACAVKGAREIAIFGHSDCQVCKMSAMNLLDAFKALGVDRHNLPENLTEFFGLFASESQNVMKGVEFVRHSPLIGPKIPVHGLMVDIGTGRLEWVVNGYQALETGASPKTELRKAGDDMLDGMKSFAAFQPGEMKFPETKIGDIASVVPQPAQPEPGQSKPAQIPAPPPLPPAKFQLPPRRQGFNVRKAGKG